MTFVFIFLGIGLVNIVIPIIFEGIGNFDFEEVKTQLVMILSIMIYTMMIIFSLKSTSVYFDMMIIFSVPRKEMMKSINITNVVLTLSGSIAVNLILLMVNIEQRLLFLVLITSSIYLIMNFLNFIAFLGKIFGWYYIVGSFILLASFIISVVNYIGGFILLGLFVPQIISFLVLLIIALFVVNKFLSSKYELKV
jgi:hypothetical protein